MGQLLIHLHVTLNSNTSITANFQVIVNSYTLTVSAGEGGSVSTEGGEYEEGTEVTISAITDVVSTLVNGQMEKLLLIELSLLIVILKFQQSLSFIQIIKQFQI
jgi:hypothetical protein